MAEGEKFNWCLTAVWWLILLAGSMYLMLVTAANKTIVIEDTTYGTETAGGDYSALRQELMLQETESESGIFLIPLEKNTKAGNVVVENSYMDRELRIFIGGAQEQFYATHTVQGDVTSIVKADRETQQSGVLLRLRMDSVYEFKTSMEGDNLIIQACKPHDLYSMVVVIDPAGGSTQGAAQVGTTQDDVLAEVCRLLSNQWNMENVKLYFTRTDKEEVAEVERLNLADAVEADIFIQLNLAQDEDATQYGIHGRYNEEYFIPNFGNVELADIVTRNVTIAAGNRAVGLSGAEEDSILRKLRIPAAGVELGYLSNQQESTLLTQEAYRQKLATGIAEAIREVYTNNYE